MCVLVVARGLAGALGEGEARRAFRLVSSLSPLRLGVRRREPGHPLGCDECCGPSWSGLPRKSATTARLSSDPLLMAPNTNALSAHECYDQVLNEARRAACRRQPTRPINHPPRPIREAPVGAAGGPKEPGACAA